MLVGMQYAGLALQRIARRVMLGEKPRSSHWATIRKHHLQEQPNCIVCGGQEHLEVHHVKPFHLHPELELDLNNLVTLCEKSTVLGKTNCHFVFGHAGDWKCFVPDVQNNAKILFPQILAARGK